MYRCLELAKLGAGSVAPNPMVGAVLVHRGRIIGEGYHQIYGGAHAEPNCIDSVKKEDRHLISESVLYVSLEPCAHHGKTPPCADLIIEYKIPKVVIGCRDPFKQTISKVQKQGIEKLKEAGIETEWGMLEKECMELNKRFFSLQTLHRPFVILKWAQTANGFMAANHYNSGQVKDQVAATRSHRLLISNEFTNRLVHKWRSEEASILIGTHTALMDDPQLTTRFWAGKNPVRLVVDMDLRLPSNLKIFSADAPTIVFNKKTHNVDDDFFSKFFFEKTGKGIFYYQVTEDVSLVHQIIHCLYRMKIESVMVEGGSRLLQSFIDDQLWDEARIITNYDLRIAQGLPAPALPDFIKVSEQDIFKDRIEIFRRIEPSALS